MRSKTVWLFQGARLSDLVIGFGWQIAAARMLSTNEFGLVAVVTSATAFAVIGASLGGDELINSARVGTIRATFVREARIRVAIGLGGVLVALFILPYSLVIFWAIVYTACTALSYLCIAYFTRQYNPYLLFLGVATQATSMFLAFIYFLPSSAEEILLILASTSALRALVTMTAAILHKEGSPRFGAARATYVRRFSLMASSASTPLLGRQLHVTLAAALGIGLAEIGAFSAAYALAYMAATVTILGIGATAMPRMADAASKSHAHIAREWRRIVVATSRLSLPAVVISMAVAPSLMSALYGPEYGDLGAGLYVAISLTLVAQRLTGGGATNALLVITDKATLLLISIFGSAAALALTDLLLMPVLGIWGAVLGSTVATIAGAVVTLYVVYRNHGATPPIRPQLTVLGIATATAAPLLVMDRYTPLGPWFILLVAGVAGILLLWLVNRLKYAEGGEI